MDIRELKTMDAPGLVRLAGTFEIENAGVLRRQELVYRIIQAQARKNGQLVADGVLETVPEGFGFLRALEASYLPGPDDVFVSAQQIRRFALLTGRCVGWAGPSAETGGALLLARPRRHVNWVAARSDPRTEDLRPPHAALP
jgi:transcription termination factor Rho